MNVVDARKIVGLQQKGYKVVVKDPLGKTFKERYGIYHPSGFQNLKLIVITDDGIPLSE